ncbi:MAG: DNA-directed RNA polymerase, subunit E'' [Candidatus Marsarchaeota archaeon]|nr:DNA-directed RNA polymerase, subunit E'' [Candidatus Marsarchaeota archaeon]
MSSRRHPSGLKACRECKYLNPSSASTCESCGSSKFADLWEGLVVIYDVDGSAAAVSVGAKKPGKYALKLY